MFALRWFELLWQGYFAIVCTQERLCEAVVEGRYFLKGDMFAFVFFYFHLHLYLYSHLCLHLHLYFIRKHMCLFVFVPIVVP